MIPDNLSEEQLDKFRLIKDKFLNNTTIPEEKKWESMSKDDIWLRMVSQVVVVGNAAPADRLNTPQNRNRLAFDTLAASRSQKAARVLGRVLADIGTRYVSRERPETSPKVKAIMGNLAFLKKEFTDGPKGLVKHLASLTTTRDRIVYLSNNFSYFKAKGARDFLTTGLGMATDVIALDSRVMGIVRRIVPDLPDKVNNGNYEAIETFLVTHVCQPLKMSAVQFDQLLFRNESAIKELLSCDATVVHDGPCLATSGSSSCGTGKRPVAAKMDRRRRLR